MTHMHLEQIEKHAEIRRTKKMIVGKKAAAHRFTFTISRDVVWHVIERVSVRASARAYTHSCYAPSA